MQTMNHNILVSNILTNVSLVYRCLLCNTTSRQGAQIYLSKCSKYPPLPFTQARRRCRHWPGCVDDTLADSFSDCNNAFYAVRRYAADGLPQFSDTLFNAGLTIYLPTHVQNFIEIGRNLAICYNKNAAVWWWISLFYFRSFMFHKVVSQHTLGVVERLQSAYRTFPAESGSEKIFKIGWDLRKLLPKVWWLLFLGTRYALKNSVDLGYACSDYFSPNC